MAELTEKLIRMGQELCYSGADLQMFIKGRDKGKRKGRKRKRKTIGRKRRKRKGRKRKRKTTGRKRKRKRKRKGRERTRTRRKKTEKRSRGTRETSSASIGKDQCRYRERARDQTQIKRFITQIPIKSI